MSTDSNLTVSSRQLGKLVRAARNLIQGYSEGSLVPAHDSVRITALLNAVKSVEKSSGVGKTPVFNVSMVDCQEWMEKEFWSDAALVAPRDENINLNFERIKRFSPDAIAVLSPIDHHTMDFEFFEYGKTGRIAYWCENDGAIYPSLSPISKEELFALLKSWS